MTGSGTPDPIDYGLDVEFGLFPSPDAARAADLLELVQIAETAGLDLVSIQDHPYQPSHLDTWTLLSFLGARTSTIRLAPNVASLPLRDPVVLAKSAATLDRLTVGRVELGLGAGAFWDGIAAAGGPRRSPGEAVDALTEAIEVIRGVWAGGRVDVDGTHYQVKGFKAGPTPAHDIPLWLGAYKPRMLRLTGRLADAWVPSMGYADPPALPELNAAIDAAAIAAGRDPREIRRLYNVFGSFGAGGGFLRGSVADWVEQLTGLVVETGMSTFILGTDDTDTLARFAHEVAPAVRQEVRRHREGASRAADEAARPAFELPRDAAVDGGDAIGAVRGPTGDDGTRLTGDLEWDESARPTLDETDHSGYTARQLANPHHLVDIHDHLRAELSRVRDVVAQVRQGQLSVGQARSIINTMAMRQNNWTLGAFCESYCRIVTGHHTLEDRSVFPHLRRSEPGLGPVLDRLESEHEVIADVLDRLDRALVALVAGDTVGQAGRQLLDNLEAEVDLLTDTLLSHLAYEERELFGPLARHGLG